MKSSAYPTSTRFEYVTPLQRPFVTNELTDRIVSVPASRFGPPESPKQVPPLPCEWLAESFRILVADGAVAAGHDVRAGEVAEAARRLGRGLATADDEVFHPVADAVDLRAVRQPVGLPERGQLRVARKRHGLVEDDHGDVVAVEADQAVATGARALTEVGMREPGSGQELVRERHRATVGVQRHPGGVLREREAVRSRHQHRRRDRRRRAGELRVPDERDVRVILAVSCTARDRPARNDPHQAEHQHRHHQQASHTLPLCLCGARPTRARHPLSTRTRRPNASSSATRVTGPGGDSGSHTLTAFRWPPTLGPRRWTVLFAGRNHPIRQIDREVLCFCESCNTGRARIAA